MAGRTPHEAVSTYLAPFQLGVSCISDAVVQAERPVTRLTAATAEARGFALSFTGGGSVLLQAVPGYSRLAFSLGQQFSLRYTPGTERGTPWKVRTEAYQYSLDDADGRERWAFHYHPAGARPITWAHFHVYGASGLRQDLAKGHYPTNRVALEDVLLLLLDLQRGQFGIRPLRTDWRQVLTRGLETFERERTWTGRGPA